MAETTLRSKKQIYNRRRPTLHVVGDATVVSPPTRRIQKDLISDHKFFINSLFCEMIEKI